MTETLTSCPNCGSARIAFWCHARDRLHEVTAEEFAYSRCQDCGVVFESVRPDESGIGAFYPSGYRPYAGAASPESAGPPSVALRALRKANRALDRVVPDRCPALVDAFYAPPRPGARLLDFGCGSAAFLDRARERGWSTLGIDVSPPTIDAVRAAGHDALLLDSGTWSSIEDGSLDLVRMNHVLEHLYDARGTLASIHAKLRPGGRLHVAVPNPLGWPSRVFKSHWFSLDAPRHVVLYPPETLRALLASAGFPDARICHETLTRDVARSVGYVLRDRGRIRHDQVEEMALRPVLAATLYAPARALAGLGVSDRYHALATRP